MDVRCSVAVSPLIARQSGQDSHRGIENAARLENVFIINQWVSDSCGLKSLSLKWKWLGLGMDHHIESVIESFSHWPAISNCIILYPVSWSLIVSQTLTWVTWVVDYSQTPVSPCSFVLQVTDLSSTEWQMPLVKKDRLAFKCVGDECAGVRCDSIC